MPLKSENQSPRTRFLNFGCSLSSLRELLKLLIQQVCGVTHSLGLLKTSQVISWCSKGENLCTGEFANSVRKPRVGTTWNHQTSLHLSPTTGSGDCTQDNVGRKLPTQSGGCLDSQFRYWAEERTRTEPRIDRGTSINGGEKSQVVVPSVPSRSERVK